MSTRPNQEAFTYLQLICNLSSLAAPARVSVREGNMHRQLASGLFACGLAIVLPINGAGAAGDLSRQAPIEVTVELGKPGQHVFVPNRLTFETGKLYKLILRNASNDPHYFTSH